MAITARQRRWLLPVVFLAGYLLAWASVVVDRQMVIASQAQLASELAEAKQQLRVFDAAGEFKSQWEEIVIWNTDAMVIQDEVFTIESPKEVPDGQVAK